MGFWDTFIRVWQVRTSVRIQRGIENYLDEQKRLNELNANIPSILNELEKKNEAWDNLMNKHKNRNYDK
jgi:Fic family protein